MTEHNNIERLFQEKLDGFEVNPPEEIWNNIEAELKKKEKKRRVIPFWWKMTGIAALLVLGYSLYTVTTNHSEKNAIQSNESVVVGKETNPSNPSKSENNVSEEIENQMGKKNKSVSSSNSDSTNKNNNKSIETAIVSNNRTTNENSNAISYKSYTNNKKTIASKSKSNLVLNSSNEKFANHSNTNGNEGISHKEKTINPKNELIPTNNNNVNNGQNNVVKNTLNENKTIVEAPQFNSQVEKNKIVKQLETEIKEEAIKKVDSAIANAELNAMEELLKEKEKKSTQKQKINRWRVTPNVAPIYFGSFANGSPLDETLNNNPKNYNNSMSYALNVGYAINKKIKVRTGVTFLSLDYDTQGIVFYQDSKAQMMKNINPTQQGSMIQIKPLNYVSTQLDRIVSERFDGVLNQKMGYIEMPIEMTYQLFGRKFGVDVSGGFSTLFLNKNEIYLNAYGTSMKIGSATNLNNIHFSTNLGLGLNYAFLKNFDARIEPTFKYQINTFSSDTGSFKPYIFGIYSGISYKF